MHSVVLVRHLTGRRPAVRTEHKTLATKAADAGDGMQFIIEDETQTRRRAGIGRLGRQQKVKAAVAGGAPPTS